MAFEKVTITNNWPLYRSVAYLGGKGIQFGYPILPSSETAFNTYSVNVDIIQNGRAVVLDKGLTIFKEESLDHFYFGPRLDCVENQEQLLREAARKLKLSGHLIVHFWIGREEPGTFPLTPSKVLEMVGKVGRWQAKGEWVQSGECLMIFKKIKGTSGILPRKELPRAPRACVCRFGALGDAIILTPVLKALKEEGYHVTFMGTPYCYPALENNPYIDNLLLQERDAVPNQELGNYWKLWEREYDRYINLSETLEGDLLIVEGRREFFTTKEWRNERCNRNYFDYTLERSGFSITGRRGELFFTEAEERNAKKFFQPLEGKFVVVWALNGSSHHKVYPMMETVLRRFLEEHPDAIAITVGDELARLLEFSHPRLIEKAGKWSVRESLIAAKYASLVIGPETMMTNAAGCFTTPKITILSHSSHENLCKYWINDYCLSPAQELAPCYPCHQLHYTRESCPIGVVEDTETGQEIGRSPVCPIAVLPLRLLNRIEEVYQKHFLKT